jgi:tripartite-type tricarboxylate transporter receptor subunit TctC
MLSRRPFVLMAALAALLPLSACGGGGSGGNPAQYPSEDISLIIPYAAGGPTDLVARAIAPSFEQQLGETVVPENREGASGAIGMNRLINSEPDGHTLMVIASTAAVVTPLAQPVEYTEADYVTLGAISQYPYVLATRADSRFATAQDLFAAARANPGSVNIGVPGASSQGAVELQRMAELYGVRTTPVPFDGNAGCITALLGGNVDAIFLVASDDVLSNVEAGQFKAVAVGSDERAKYLPQTPTFAELGFPELTLGTSYYGLAAPAGTPPEITGRLEDTLRSALADPKVAEQIGAKYVPEEFIDGKELSELFAEQRAAYTPILTGGSR